jgi:alpha-D-xyloside xylohydrolase
MSRAYYKTREETLEVAKELREHHIPCDVIVLDGRAWHKMETRFDFQWDADRYPDPAGFVHKLREQHYRLCLWEYPYISIKSPLFDELAEKGYLLKTQDGEPYIHRWLPPPNDYLYPHLQPSGILDFTHPEAYQWYLNAHKPLFDVGASVMKTDYGESIPEDAYASNGDTGKRLHNVYSLLYNQCVFQATEKYGRDGAMVWGRAGWVGSQRFPIQWGGDPQCDWESLAASIRGGLSYGMSGVPYYSHDIGGYSGDPPPAELYVRWAQAGVMMSHTRFHGAGLREPWAFGELAESIIKKWLAWRYQLIPYLQACALEACRDGLPVMRAMPLAFPDDPRSWGFEEQYMLGPALLVVPVLSPENEVRYYLPEGTWFDIWTEERIQGPQLISRQVPLDHIPIYGREGCILPLGPAVQHTGELAPDVDLNEVWVFGKPQQGITLPGLEIKVEEGAIVNLPPHVTLRRWE